jgi:hypothetical protein
MTLTLLDKEKILLSRGFIKTGTIHVYSRKSAIHADRWYRVNIVIDTVVLTDQHDRELIEPEAFDWDRFIKGAKTK